MNKILNWLKWFWDELGKPINYPEGHNPFADDLYTRQKPREDKFWCPYCGASFDEYDGVRCHLLNDHKNEKP